MLRDAAAYYKAALSAPEGHVAREYLATRKISPATAETFALGFAPPAPPWDALVVALRALGHDASALVDAGVARKHAEKEGVYDVLRGRIVVPIRDEEGVPLSLAGRLIPGCGKVDRVPKYINGAESAIFRKGDVLFGRDVARGAARRLGEDGFVVIVEGYMDVLALFERTVGSVAVVASMGTALTAVQLKEAWRLLGDGVEGRVIINFDGDAAGVVAVERLCESVIPGSGVADSVYVAVPPPEVKDAGEFFDSGGSGDEYVKYLLEVALPWYEWCGRRVVMEECEYLKLEDEGKFKGDIPGKRTMMRLDPSTQSFDLQLAEEIAKQSEEMMVAYGGPPELAEQSRAEAEKRKNLYVCKEVVEALAGIIDRAARCMPGLNVGAVVEHWADLLSRGNMLALAPIFRAVIARAEELAEPWKQMSVKAQISWMPPAPWLVEELPKWKRKAFEEEEGGGLDGLDGLGDAMDAMEVSSQSRSGNRKRMKESMRKVREQEAVLLPFLEQYRSERVKRVRDKPRVAAEEMVLRSLIFAEEVDRLDALAKLLEVLMRCAERELPFWTSEPRERLFEFLSEADGRLRPEEIAAEVEGEEWWIEEIEDLFIRPEEESDLEWQAIRLIEVDSPVQMVASTAQSIELMARTVASRVALAETSDIVRTLNDRSEELESEEVERLIAKQITLRKAVNKSKYLTPEEEAELKKAEEDRRRKEEEEKEKKIIFEQLKTGSVPYPENFDKKANEERMQNKPGGKWMNNRRLPDNYPWL